MADRPEAGVRRRIGKYEFLFHANNERKEHLLLLSNMRPQILPELFNEFFYSLELVGLITKLVREFARLSDQARQILAYSLVMNANDMLNQK